MKDIEGWPEGDEVADFESLVTPVIDALKQVYILDRRGHGGFDVKWSGPTLGRTERVTSLSFDNALTKENLEYSEHDQGRDPLTTIIGIAIQLGIEQGRRIHKKDLTFDIRMAKLLFEGLEQKNEDWTENP